MKKIDSYYYIMPKINSGSIKDLNVKNQNLKKIVENNRISMTLAQGGSSQTRYKNTNEKGKD